MTKKKEKQRRVQLKAWLKELEKEEYSLLLHLSWLLHLPLPPILLIAEEEEGGMYKRTSSGNWQGKTEVPTSWLKPRRSIDGYTIEMARTHTLTHNKRRERKTEPTFFFGGGEGKEDRWMRRRRRRAEKRGIMSWRCTKTRWKIDRTRLHSHIRILLHPRSSFFFSYPFFFL